MERKQCILSDCHRPRHYADGYCNPHHDRMVRYGDPRGGSRVATDHSAVCSVEGCGAAYYARDLCLTHYARFKTHGSVGDPRIRSHLPVATPGGAHTRVHKLWGSASQYLCISCSKQAKDWAYDGADPAQGYAQQGTEGGWVFFSSWPEFYMPMCRLCHKGRDGALVKEELREYRQWKTTTRLTLADLSVQ